MTLTAVAGFVVVAATFFALRLYPLWPNRFQGCDAYNILLCARALRRAPRLPICLPELFLLEDDEQWYPPGFLILCALFRENWLEHYYWMLNSLIDLGSLATLYWLVAWLGQPWAAAAAGFAYAATPGLANEFSSLNVRPFGLMLFNLFMVAAALGMTSTVWLVVACAVGVVLLYSHKLSAQQLWFTLPVLALGTGDWRWAVLLPAIYALAFAVWPRGFSRIVHGHVAIVRFWHRHWPLLGAHMIRQSPIYGDGKTHTEVFAHDGWRARWDFAKSLLHQNYFVVPAVLLAAEHMPRQGWPLVFALWAVSVYVWGAAIHLLRWLRGIGLGMQYFKFALAPTLAYVALAAPAQGGVLTWFVVSLAAILAARQYALVSRLQRGAVGATAMRNLDLEPVLSSLAADPAARIMCFPLHLCDLVAFATGRPTYWGTHSHCFDERLARFFPVLRQPLADYVADGQLTHLLIDTRYVVPAEIGLEPRASIMTSGRYELYQLDAGAVTARPPIAAAVASAR